MLTYERAIEVLTYNPKNGKFIRNTTGAYTGTISEGRKGEFRETISIDNKRYLSHRLAFLIMTKKCQK